MRRLVLVLLLLASSTAVVQGVLPCDVAAVSPSCYAALRPGPVEDAIGLVELEGEPTSASEGQLLLTTVSVDADLDLGEWLQARRDARLDDVPRELYFPEGVDEQQTREEFAVMMEQSQQTATLAALGQLGYDLDPRGAEVREVVEGSPSDGLLQAGDVVVGVDGRVVATAGDLAEAVQQQSPGDVVTLAVEGAGTGTRTEQVELAPNPDDPTAGFVGLLLVTAVDLPVEVTIDAGSIGGPSAGLVFALSIVDLLTPQDLTGGRIVAGTGTIDVEGRVGPIGGIRQKVVGATQRGEAPPAEVFLVPRDNLAEARTAAVDRDVVLVPVDTLDDAVEALAAVRDGREPADAVALGPAG